MARDLRRLGELHALGAEHFLELAGLEHLADDVAAADEFTLHIELGDGRPLGEFLDPLAQAGVGQDVDAFETRALHETGTDFPNVPTRYRSSYFLHIWANGYASGYYAYQWTVMLDDDAYAWFTKNGGLTRANGQRFRDMILSKGHTEDYGPMFQAFYGKDPDTGPMLEHRGLTPPK